uniref:Uncharacterized protein n=1 Tax=Panagrolaimus sp. JU765 TaxID=591449 RepID=A0AC34RHV2_9BILA
MCMVTKSSQKKKIPNPRQPTIVPKVKSEIQKKDEKQIETKKSKQSQKKKSEEKVITLTNSKELVQQKTDTSADIGKPSRAMSTVQRSKIKSKSEKGYERCEEDTFKGPPPIM